MKKILLSAIMAVAILAIAHNVYAQDQSLSTTVTGTVASIFSLEFYTDANVLYSSTVPFTSVDPGDQYNYPDGRAEDDGKSDVGLLVTSNQSTPWYLKVGLTPGSELTSKLAYYMGQPYNRNWGTPSDGSIGHGDWFNIPSNIAPETMYTAGTADQLNTPFGTLATLSFKIDGAGLSPGGKTVSVTYTLTQTP
ncbi:hypothetical protein ACFL1I_00100 [Candidatus Omnitrophota bacterium]